MRALPSEQDFAKFLLKLGNGELQKAEVDDIKLPAHCIVQDGLIESVLGECIKSGDFSEVAKRTILCTTNEACRKINEEVLGMVSGETKVFTSRDEADADEATNYVQYPEEYLNSLHDSGLPPHKLTLKEGVPVMLLRNLSVEQGLVNGTRLIVKSMKSKVQVR